MKGQPFIIYYFNWCFDFTSSFNIYY